MTYGAVGRKVRKFCACYVSLTPPHTPSLHPPPQLAESKTKNNDGDLRDEMSAYWMEHAKSTTVESMMLDDNAASITASDMEEVLAMLPPYEGDDVCEVRQVACTIK